ncbi:MAG: tetratricopeptide repeat protein [Candidatus Aminicenantes bacterium]|nr:MAG: tetratricopeptide repeat protein [Candidatus Aminicenantes bacterium]
MKRKKVFSIVVILVITLCSSSLLFPQLTRGKGKMSGQVTDQETGQPLAGVTVKLYCPGVQQYYEPSPKTDAEGKWKVFYVRKGRWDLDFVKEGYEVKKISFFVDPTPGTKNPPIELQLRKLTGPALTQDIMKEVKNAAALITEKKYDQALQELQAVLEKYKEEAGVNIVYLHMGNIYSYKGQYQKALEYYLKSLEKFPDNKEIILSIGNAYSNLNDFDKATEWFNKLNIDDIGNVDTLYNIGVIAYNKGDFERAVTFFKKATEIDSQFADGFYQLGMTYVALEKNQEGVAALKKFMEIAPDSPNYETAKAVVEAFEQ